MHAACTLVPAHPPAPRTTTASPSNAARAGAAGLFLTAVLLLVVACRRLRDRVRVDEANAALRADYDRLDRGALPPAAPDPSALPPSR